MAKSFSIKIGADTQEFIKGLRDAQKEITNTQKNAQALEKSLDVKYEPKRAIEAQRQYQKALEQTEEKAESIRKRLKELEDSGRIDTADYQRLNTELIHTETQAISLKQSLEKIKNIDIDQLSKKFTDLGGKIESAGKKIAPFSAVAAGGIAAAAKLAKDAVATGDEIATLATQYDMSTKAIQRWQYVAMQTDVESQTLLKSIQKTQAAFGEQSIGGTTAAVKALDALGLSYKNFDSNEEMFAAVIESLSYIDDKTVQVAYATDIMGERYASALIPMLQSKDAVAGFVAEFEQVGYISDEAVQKLSQLDNEVNKTTAQFELAKTQLGVAMIPIYQTLVELLENSVIPAMQKLGDWFSNLSPRTQESILAVAAFIAVAGPLLILIGKLTTGIGAMIKLLPTFTALLNQTATAGQRAGAAVALLGGALLMGLDLISNWKEMSTVEKILKSLAVAALVAAAAMTVFHASWSVGIAVGAIAAGVVAGIAAIKAASKEIGVEDDFSSSYNTTSKGYSQSELDSVYGDIGSKQPATTQNNMSNSVTNNTSNDVFNIYIQGNEYVSAEEVADIVSKRIATLSQARG